jgi:hypothetical protein
VHFIFNDNAANLIVTLSVSISSNTYHWVALLDDAQDLFDRYQALVGLGYTVFN